MLKRLRRKFILINMSFVAAVLLIVFAALWISSSNRLRDESWNALRVELELGSKFEGMQRPPVNLDLGERRPKQNFNAFPVFSVMLDGAGDVVSVSTGQVTVTGEAAAEAAAAARAAGGERGTLPALGLRFLTREIAGGTRIAFADISRERSELRNLLLSSLLVGLGGLVAFFFISLFLAGWALRPVERAWKQQRQFVADASHELKTPLTVILANMNILRSHRESTIAAQSKWVEHTQAEANRMKKLVDDLLFLAKSDDARAAVRACFSLSDAVWSSVLPLESVAFEQGVELKSDIAPALTMVGDEAKIRQLVVILLDNACKYTPKGGRVSLSLTGDPERARLIVKNTGAPIPKEHLEHLFERFYRSEDSRAREQGGYGLGLAIAKSIVDEHRGRIAVASGEAEGTAFTVSLPLRLPAGSGAGAHRPRGKTAGGK